jgi:predicted RNase H-like HicB family nuclease
MINAIISNMKATEGKTPEELMELAKKALNQG